MERFGFEDLRIWQESIAFAEEVFKLIDHFPPYDRLAQQTFGAVSSISQNIAEGNGRHYWKENLQFLYYARGSLYETITLLEILTRRKSITPEHCLTLKSKALVLAKQLNAYISYVKGLQYAMKGSQKK